MAVWVSSGAFKAKTIADLLDQADEAEISAIELSSGMPYAPDTLDAVRRAHDAGRQRFMIHNYFPPPARPFVLNVGALDNENLQNTKDLAKLSTDLAKDVGAPFYSIHAGFAARLSPDTLGRPEALAASLSAKNIDRKASYDVMCDTVRGMADYASSLGLELLVENNVIAPVLLNRLGVNPLLLTAPREIAQFFDDVQHSNVGLLLDVAHAKVSAAALGCSPHSYFEELEAHVRCLHLSDNDGREDSNLPIQRDSWFLPYLRDLRDREIVIEVYRLERDEIRAQRDLVQTELG